MCGKSACLFKYSQESFTIKTITNAVKIFTKQLPLMINILFSERTRVHMLRFQYFRLKYIYYRIYKPPCSQHINYFFNEFFDSLKKVLFSGQILI